MFKKKATTNRVLTDEIKAEIQYLHSQGEDINEIAKTVDVKVDTLSKAIRQGRIKLPEVPAPSKNCVALTKTERSVIDVQSGMGKACTFTLERVLAATTGETATASFSEQVDVHCAGVLFSLPALLANGLLRHSEKFKPDEGYYSVESVFISLALLALLRAKTLAQSEAIPCGELGRTIGLDRIPEVKTLRKRIERFCARTDVKQWSLTLSKEWMAAHPELAGILYIDGHINIYHGSATKMPKHYASRLKLCMSGSTDYWVNDNIGQPFFVINEAIAGSMIEKIKEEIIPQLDKDVPCQPSMEALEENPYLSRYMLVCDREIYSPEFFHDLWQKRIAVCTYKKNVKDKWPEEEFTPYEEVLPEGETVKIELAERGVLLESIPLKGGSKKEIWCREVRKRSESGHQTSIITTNFTLNIMMIGVYMFARWYQENFFKYMMEHFDIDGLVSYLKETISDTKYLVNPIYRKLESELKKLNAKLIRKRAKFAALTLKEQEIEDKKMKKYLAGKAVILEEIEQLENEVLIVKNQIKGTKRKITFAQLPKDVQFTNAINVRKHFMDTIKIIAYRAETGMCNIIKKQMGHPDEVRKLIREIYQTDADIKPDYENKKLTIYLHKLNHWKDDKVAQILCDELNKTKTEFPGTDLVINYRMVSS